ncbi:hypothetical protein FKM82_006446 [Ascaphus truei]
MVKGKRIYVNFDHRCISLAPRFTGYYTRHNKGKNDTKIGESACNIIVNIWRMETLPRKVYSLNGCKTPQSISHMVTGYRDKLNQFFLFLTFLKALVRLLPFKKEYYMNISLYCINMSHC